MVGATIVVINGQARLPPSGLGCPGDSDFHDFELIAPLQDDAVLDCSKSDTGKKGAVMNFEACVKKL